jgi:putative endonuclease
MKIVARNARCALGEIDMVVRDGKTIVFVEVKSRFGAGYGAPQESITPAKQRKLTRLAQWYLKQHRLEGQPARFDVVAVTWRGEESELIWIANAFEARE